MASSSRKFIVPSRNIPRSVNWSPIVSRVRRQGNCNSCWAFVALGCVETLRKIINPDEDLIELSKQELVDCLPEKFKPKPGKKTDEMGCQTNSFEIAFTYIMQYGVATEEHYPYRGEKGDCIPKTDESRAIKITGFETVDSSDVTAILKALSKQPLGAQIEVYDSFANLKEGIYEGRQPTDTKRLGLHAIMLVGYDTDEENGVEYFLVKNSWGEGWGVNGFGRIRMSANLISKVSYPIIDVGL